MPVSPAQAARHLLKLHKAQDSFEGFVRSMYPEFVLADFQLELIKALDDLESGALAKTRLLVTMPPRHGKSFLATSLFPVYYLAKKPNRNVLSTSYNFRAPGA